MIDYKTWIQTGWVIIVSLILTLYNVLKPLEIDINPSMLNFSKGLVYLQYFELFFIISVDIRLRILSWSANRFWSGHTE